MLPTGFDFDINQGESMPLLTATWFRSILYVFSSCTHWNNTLITVIMHLQQILVLSASAAATISPQPTATISSGVIYGSSTNLPNNAATVNKFLGIPYATARRFSHPSDPPPWPSPLNTTHFGPACHQNFGLNGT